MSFLRKLLGLNKDKKQKQEKQQPLFEDNNLPWIKEADNKWGKKLLDLRPITYTMLSSSKDPRMATNAISYRQEDGTSFWGQAPKSSRTITTNISLPIDRSLEPGVIFKPETMEHKWAIYFDGESLIFIRSWLREVFVVAKTVQKNNILTVQSITGEFTQNESPEFTKAVLNFILISHGVGEVVPAPLPVTFAGKTRDAALWAFSTYGKMAAVGIFEENFITTSEMPLRSHSLLHIAVAKGDMEGIQNQISKGVRLDYLAGDGLAPLHWSISNKSIEPMKMLLKSGSDPDVRSHEGETALMHAVQSNKIEFMKVLIESGANVNSQDYRGFTALHRAAEIGHKDALHLLLTSGADKTIEAQGYTALALSKLAGNQEIIDLLS